MCDSDSSVDADSSSGDQNKTYTVETSFSPKEWSRIQQAVDAADFETASELVREGGLQLLEELIDDGGDIDCPHDDCERSFPTRRELRGHLGSSEHALNIPEGEFWCGYCGYGPTSWRGVNAHHGGSDHDGDPVRLSEEPSQEDLIAPDNIPDHKNPELLKELYEKYDENYSKMCREHDFEVTDGRVRHYLVEFGIHDVTPQGSPADGSGPKHRDPEWLREKYEKAGGNVSQMHRQIDADIPYRTLLSNLKKLGIHSPEADEPDESVDGSVETDESKDSDGSETGQQQEGGGVPDNKSLSSPDSEDVDVESLLLVDNPEDVSSFSDLDTPEWLNAGSFYSGVEMADNVDELSEILGWQDTEALAVVVEVLDIALGEE